MVSKARPCVSSRSGTRSLTQEDLDAWKASRVTLGDLANRCGVSIAAVSKAFARRGSKAPPPGEAKVQASSRGAKPLVGQNPSTPSSLPILPALPTFTSEDAGRLAQSAAFAILVQAHEQLTSQPLGPSALKAVMTAVRESAAMLGQLGVISLDEVKAASLPVLRVVCMTAEEEAAIREAAERQFEEFSKAA